eukprot:scaffold60067_cov62-Phaeocystis_antarctica.AAC.2
MLVRPRLRHLRLRLRHRWAPPQVHPPPRSAAAGRPGPRRPGPPPILAASRARAWRNQVCASLSWVVSSIPNVYSAADR